MKWDEFKGRTSDMPMDAYHAHKALGSTGLKYGLKSMAHFKAYKDGLVKLKESRALDIGKVVHSCILEQDFSGYVKGPDVDKRTKAWKEFEKDAKQSGKIVLSIQDYEQLKGMFDAFFKHPIATRAISKGKAEETFIAEDKSTGLLLKARPDYIVESEKGNYIVNFKTAQAADRDSFERAIYNYRYDFSEAHYIDVIEQAIGLHITDSLFIVIEKEPPYLIGIYRSMDSMIERAMQRRRHLLNRIAECEKSGQWPGLPIRPVDVDLPGFAITKEEMEIGDYEQESDSSVA